MATLRDPFFEPNTVSLDEMERLQTSGMGSLRRGWESGRIGAGRNALGIDAAAARANGELEQAAELQAQNDALAQRQAVYAPAVQKVEDINSVGSGLDWAASQVGQGVASMVDPVAAATAVGGVGRVAGMLPGGAGKIGRAIGAFGAPAAAFGINQRQMAGEFVNTAAQDEELMARTSPQELYNTANMVGAAGGALDTVLPGIIGRQLAGGALRQGMKAMGAGMGPLAKTGLGMLGEGGTEWAQGKGSQYALGQLNPNRDTSGDASDDLNNALGGAVGGSPLTAAGAYADAGYNRAGQAAGFVGEKAGQAADFVGAKTGQVLDMAQEAYDGSALQRGVDTAGEKAKGLFGAGKGKIIDLATDEEGNRSASALVKNLRAKTSEVYDSMEEALNESAILSGTPPKGMDVEGPEFETWFTKNNEERIGLLDKRLTQMAEKGDPKAGELADRIFSSPDAAQQGAAVEEAAQYLQDNSNLDAFLKRAEENSRLGGRIAGAAGAMVRKVGGAIVDGAVSMGKAALNGFKEGGKKNMQGAVITDKDAWQIPPEEKALIDRFWGPEIKHGSPEVKAAREESYQRAEDAATTMEMQAALVKQRAHAYRVTVDEEAVTNYLRSVGTDLAILVDEVNTSKEVRAGTLANQAVDNVMDPRRPATKGGAFSIIPDSRADNQGKYSALAVKVNRIASEIHQAYGTNANEVIEQLALNLGEAAGPTMDYLRHEVALLQSKQGVRHTAQLRRQASQALVQTLDPGIKHQLLKQGVNLGSKSGSETLLKMVESIANERVDPAFSRVLAEVIGRDNLDKLVSLVAPPTRMREEAEYINDSEMLTTDSGLQMNDDGEVVDSAVSANGYEASMAERKVEKSQKAGGKIYGFYGAAGLRTSGRGLDNDPFRPVDRATKAEVAAWDEQAKERRARRESPDYDSDPRQKNLPQLIPLRIEGAANTATRRMQNALKLSQSDRAMADELQSDAEQGVGPNISTRRAAAVRLWTERAAAGDADAQAKLDDLRNGMFENRRGGFSTKVVSAAEVMKERGTTEPRMVSLFAGYMTQLAKGAENSQDPSKSQYGFRPAQEMRVLSSKARRWLAKDMGADVESTPQERRDVHKAMAEFFENYGMVVAERLGDLDTEMITPNTILDMDRSAKKIVSLNRRYKDSPDKQRQHGLDANILVFRSRLSTEKTATGAEDGDGEGDVFIKVGDLVRLVRERQGMRHSTDFEADSEKSKDKEHLSGTSKNEKLLADLFEGVAMMVGSGFTNGMPAMFAGGDNRIKFGSSNMKRNGNPAVMALGGVPEQIRLVTTNVKGYANALANRPKQPADGDTVGQHSDMFVFARAHKDFPATVDALHKEMGTTQGASADFDAMVEYRASLELKASVKRGMDKLKALGAEEYNKRLAAAYEKAGIAPRDEPNTPKDQARGEEPFVSDSRTEQEPSGYQRSLQLVGEERSMFLQLTSEHGPEKGREKFINYLHKKVEQEWRDKFAERGTEMLSDYEKRVYARAPNEFIKRAATDAADARVEEFMENGPTGAMFATFDNMTTDERSVKGGETDYGAPKPVVKKIAHQGSRLGTGAAQGLAKSVGAAFDADEYTNAGGRRANRSSEREHEAKTGKTNKTPIDFTKGQDPQNPSPDDYADQRRTSIAQGFKASAPDAGAKAYPQGRMKDKGVFHGEALIDTLISDVDKGMEEVKTWMRMGLSPAYGKGKYDLVGGPHLFLPVAIALNPDRRGGYDMVPADHKAVETMRNGIMKTLLTSPMSPASKLMILREMAPSSEVDDWVAPSMNRLLADYVARNPVDDKELQAAIAGSAASSKTRAEIDAASTKAVADYYRGITGNKRAEELIKALGQRLINLGQGQATAEQVGEAITWTKAQLSRIGQGLGDYTLSSTVREKLQMAQERAQKLLAKAQGTQGSQAAPEVAAGAPKAQASPQQGGAQGGKTRGTYDSPIIGDLWAQPGVKVVSTNLGGVHGRGLAKQAKDKGLITAENRDFDSSPEGDVITLAVKGHAPETAKVPGRAFSEQVTGKNVDLLKNELRKLIRHARSKPDTDFYLPYVGLGFGEGDAAVIGPLLEATAREPNIHLVTKDQGTVDRYASSFAPGVRRDGTTRGKPVAQNSKTEINDHQSSGYRERTKFNADSADLTVAVALTAKSPYAGKDQRKAGRATKFIGRGSARSSTAQYAKDFGGRANTGSYTAADTVFVSAEGGRPSRVDPDFAEIGKAVKAGATIITDSSADREREYNIGERQVAEFLTKQGYTERTPGEWGPPVAPRKLNAQSNQSVQDAILETFPERVRMIALMVDADILDAFASGDVEKLVELSDTAILMLRKEYKVGENESNSVNPELKAVTDYVRSRTLNAMEAFVHTEADAAVRRLLDKGPTPLKKVMSAAVKHLPRRFHAVADAIATVAPNVMVSPQQGEGDTRGTYNAAQRTASVWAPPGNYGMALAAMHEGVHAATVHAMQQNPELKRLARQVMDAAVAHNKGIAFEYGFENEYEFVAEAMTNVGLQATLRAIPADPSIRGELKALNLWGKFIKLIKKSLGITEESALSQVLELGAAAMRVQWDKKPPPPSSTIGIKKNPAGRAQEPDSPTPPNNSGVATDAEIKAAKDEVAKTLGPQFRVDFQDITGYSGEFIEAEDLIVIAKTAAAGAMQTTYHESLHAFFSKFLKGNPDALELMDSLANDPKIMARVTAMLAKYPAAQAQLVDGEERLAYIYQFWRAGMLDLPTKPRKFFQKLRRFFAQVLGRINDSERATAILEAFSEGKFANASPSAAGKIITEAALEGTLTTRQLRKMDAAVQKLRSLVMPAHAILTNSDSAEARRLANILWSNPGDEESSTTGTGYLNARYEESARYKNMLGSIIVDLSDRDIKDVAQYLQAKTELADIPYEPHRAAVEKTRALLQRFYRYMKDERGMDIGYRDGSMYFPRVWDQQELVSKADEFKAMLMDKYSHVLKDGASTSQGKLTEEDVAERIYRAVLNRGVTADQLPPARDDGVLSPFFGSKEMRQLAWLDNADIEPFLSKDLVNTLTTYFHGGARAAEYTSRFGEDGKRLESALTKIGAEIDDAAARRFGKGEFSSREASTKWAHRQMQQVQAAVGAIEGTVGNGDFSRAWRNTTAWLTMYQNVRLLPMTLFASVVDPLGMVARGATMTEAFDTLTRALKGVFANWGDMLRGQPKERVADHWEKLALAVGSVDADLFAHHVADEYSSAYMTKGAKRINDFFFRANGMESFNRGMRVGATKSAVQFIQRHAALPEAHSARWLKELGLTKDMLKMDADGQLIVDKHELIAQGMGKAEAEVYISRMYSAINRWVQGAILTPNAAQRPAWSSDPTYSIFFHLKQFSYSFHQTVLKRAVNEMNHGNMAPIAAFAGYIPVMLVSDLVKGLIQGGGELPAHMKGMDLGDHIMRASERAGLLGIGQVGVDAGQDMWSLGGPAVEQIMDSFTAPLSQTTLNALPANPLYKNWVN